MGLAATTSTSAPTTLTKEQSLLLGMTSFKGPLFQDVMQILRGHKKKENPVTKIILPILTPKYRSPLNMDSIFSLLDYTCSFETGDGDGKKVFVGDVVGDVCINECIKRKRNDDDTINGVAIVNREKCECVRRMKRIKKMSHWYQSCYLKEKGNGKLTLQTTITCNVPFGTRVTWEFE